MVDGVVDESSESESETEEVLVRDDKGFVKVEDLWGAGDEEAIDCVSSSSDDSPRSPVGNSSSLSSEAELEKGLE